MSKSQTVDKLEIFLHQDEIDQKYDTRITELIIEEEPDYGVIVTEVMNEESYESEDEDEADEEDEDEEEGE